MRTRTAFATLGLVAIAPACAPYTYQAEVKAFSDGVSQSSGAYRGFLDRAEANYERDQLSSFAEEGAPLALSPECAPAAGDPSSDLLVADALCLAAWSKWRISGSQPGSEPVCTGASADVAEGKLVSYSVSQYYEEQSRNCKIGVRTSNGVDFETVQDASYFYANYPALLRGLVSYADGLTEVVSAEDRDALRSSLASAKREVEKQAELINKITNSSTVPAPAVGGGLDLFGVVFVWILDYRRLQGLRQVVLQADPVVQDSAALLSQSALPLLLSDSQLKRLELARAVRQTNNQPRGQDWYKSYAEIQRLHGESLTLLKDSPTDLFQSMAVAHARLAERLRNSASYDELVKAITEFVIKAEQAYEFFTSLDAAQPPA